MKTRCVLLLTLLCAGMAQAQSLYRWVGPDGKVNYGDRPPPSAAKEMQERKYAAPAADKQLSFGLRQAVENFPAVVYVTAECDAPCKQARDYLNKRGVPFTEKTVATDAEIATLRERLGGGDLSVPVLQVGEKTRVGFLESAWAGLLDAAGYPKAP